MCYNKSIKLSGSKKHNSNLPGALGAAIVLFIVLSLVGFFKFFLHRDACPASEVVIAANSKGDAALVSSIICEGWGGSQRNSVLLQFHATGKKVVVARAEDALYPRWFDDTRLIIYVANKKSIELLKQRIEDVQVSLATGP
jgi:hypothetical protein